MHTELYHISPEKYYDSIMLKGLVPAMSDGLGRMPDQLWRNEVIWLTHDPKYILTEHAWDGWRAAHRPIVYVIDVLGLNVVRRDTPTYFNLLGQDVEFLHYGVISSDRILKVDRDYYKALQ